MASPAQIGNSIKASDFAQTNQSEAKHVTTKDDGKIDNSFLPAQLKELSILSPTSTDKKTIFYTLAEITITKIYHILRGSASPSYTWTLFFDTDRDSVSPTSINLPTTTNTTGAANELDFSTITKAVDFPTESAYASITDAAQTGLDLSDDFTLEAWIKPDNTAGYSFFLEKGDWATQGGRQYSFGFQDDDLTLWVGNGTTTSALQSTLATITQGVWSHVAVSYDRSAGSAKFYVNGVLKQTVTGGVTTINTTSEQFTLGARWSGGAVHSWSYEGAMRDARVWNDIRTDAEIADNMNAELVGNESGLQAVWTLNDVWTDDTANANTLTPTNSPVFFELQNPVVPANSFVWIESSAKSGTVDEFFASIQIE